MHIHLWLGRVALTLGIIDGALGFRISGTLKGAKWPEGWKIAYGVISGIVWIVYVGICIVWVELKKVPRAAPPSPGAPPETILMLVAQDSKDHPENMRLTMPDAVVTASASDVESARNFVAMPRRGSRTGGWVKL